MSLQQSQQSQFNPLIAKQKENHDEGNPEQRDQILNKIIQQYKQVAYTSSPVIPPSNPTHIISTSFSNQEIAQGIKKTENNQNILQQININKELHKETNKESNKDINKETNETDQQRVSGEGINGKQGTNLPPLVPKNIQPSKAEQSTQQQQISQNVRSSISKWIQDTNNIPGIAPYEPYNSRSHVRQSSMVNLTSISSQSSTNNLIVKGSETTTNNNNNNNINNINNNYNNSNISNASMQKLIKKHIQNESVQEMVTNRIDTIKIQQDINSEANSQFKKEFIHQIVSGNGSSNHSFEVDINKSKRASFDCALTQIQPYEPLYNKQALRNSKKLENTPEDKKITKPFIATTSIYGDTKDKKLLTTSQIDKIFKRIDNSKQLNTPKNDTHNQQNGHSTIEDSLINLTASITGQAATQLKTEEATKSNAQQKMHIDSFSDRLLNFQYNKKDQLARSNEENEKKMNKKESNNGNIQQKDFGIEGTALKQYDALRKSILSLQQQQQQGMSINQPQQQNAADIYKYDFTSKNIIAVQNRIHTEASEYSKTNILKIKERLATDPSTFQADKEITPSTNKANDYSMLDQQLSNNLRRNRYGQDKQRSNTIATNYPLPTQNELLNFENQQDIKFSFNGSSTQPISLPFNFASKITFETNQEKSNLLDEKSAKTHQSDLNKWFYNSPISDTLFATSSLPRQPIKATSSSNKNFNHSTFQNNSINNHNNNNNNNNNNNDDNNNSINKTTNNKDLEFKQFESVSPLMINLTKHQKEYGNQKGTKNLFTTISQPISIAPSPRYIPFSATSNAGPIGVGLGYNKINQNKETKETKKSNNDVQNRSFRSSSNAQPISIMEYFPNNEDNKLYTSQIKLMQKEFNKPTENNQNATQSNNNKNNHIITSQETEKVNTDSNTLNNQNFNKQINQIDNQTIQGNMYSSVELFKKNDFKHEKLPSTQYLDELLGRNRSDSQAQSLNFSPNSKGTSSFHNSLQMEHLVSKEIEKRVGISPNQNSQEKPNNSSEKYYPRKASQFSGVNDYYQEMGIIKATSKIQVDATPKDNSQSKNDDLLHSQSSEKINCFIKGLKDQNTSQEIKQVENHPYPKVEETQPRQNELQRDALNDIKESFGGFAINTGVVEQNKLMSQNMFSIDNSFSNNTINMDTASNLQEQVNSTSIMGQYVQQSIRSISSQQNQGQQSKFGQDANFTSAHVISDQQINNKLGQQANQELNTKDDKQFNQDSFNNKQQNNNDDKDRQIKNQEISGKEQENNLDSNNNNNDSSSSCSQSSQEYIDTDQSLLENSYKLMHRKQHKSVTVNLHNTLKSNLGNKTKNNTPDYFSNPFSIDKNSVSSTKIFVSPKFEGTDNYSTPSNNTNNQYSSVSPFETIPPEDFLNHKELLQKNAKILQSAYEAFNIQGSDQLLNDSVISDEKIAKILQSNEKRNKQQEQMIRQNQELYEKIKKTLYGLESDQSNQSQQKTLLLQDRASNKTLIEHASYSSHTSGIHSQPNVEIKPSYNPQVSDISQYINKIKSETTQQDNNTKNEKLPKIDLNEKKTNSCLALHSYSANASPINQVDINTLNQPITFNKEQQDSADAAQVAGRIKVKHQSHFSSSSHHLVPNNESKPSQFKNQITQSPEKREKAGSITEQITHFIQNNFSVSQTPMSSQNSSIQQKLGNPENNSFRGEGSFTSSSSSNTANRHSYEFSTSHSPIIMKKKLDNIVPIIEETKNVADNQLNQPQQQQQEQKQPIIVTQKVQYQKASTPMSVSSSVEQNFSSSFHKVQNIMEINNQQTVSNILKSAQAQASQDGNNATTTTVTVQVMQVKQMPMPAKFMKRYFNPRNDSILFDNFFKKENFRIGKHLGSGKFSEVHMAQDIKSGLIVALKKIKKEILIKYKSEDYLENEIKIQSFFNHPNILKLYGFYYDQEFVYLVQEYASHGELYHELKKQPNERFDEVKAAAYMRQICDAFTYLHRQHVIHRDIKPENILMSFGVLKIADFGCSVYCPEDRRDTFCGTIDYISPEIVNGESYGQSVDIWSLGILTYELLTGKSPFQYETKNEILHNILNVNIQIPDYLSEDAQDFMKHLLVRDPSKRMSMEQVINHKWITSNLQTYSSEQWDSELAQTFKKLVV